MGSGDGGDGTSTHIVRARGELIERLRLFESYGAGDVVQLRDEMARALRRYFSTSIRKRPIIVPYVMEV